MERLEEYGEFRYNGVAYRSVDEVSQAPGSYRGTKPQPACDHVAVITVPEKEG